MKKFLFSLYGLLFVFNAFANSMDGYSSTYNGYTEDEYTLALEQSRVENKLVFLDFHAKWCTPCKWMEKTTLKDSRVVAILEEKYITVKVDIDDFDGFDLKQQYEVQSLPTMIFLNSRGKMIDRINETIGTEKFLKLIKNQSANIKPKVYPSNTSPFANKQSDVVNKSPSNILKKATVRKSSTIAKTVEKAKTKDTKKYAKIKKSYANTSSNKARSTSIKKHLTLQMGVYSSQENADRKQKYISSVSNLPTSIVSAIINGKQIYRVMLGEFHSLDAAKRYKYKLQRKHRITSIIK